MSLVQETDYGTPASPSTQLVTLATQTFDSMGLDFNRIARPVDFQSKAEYLKTVEDPNRSFYQGRAFYLALTKR